MVHLGKKLHTEVVRLRSNTDAEQGTIAGLRQDNKLLKRKLDRRETKLETAAKKQYSLSKKMEGKTQSQKESLVAEKEKLLGMVGNVKGEKKILATELSTVFHHCHCFTLWSVQMQSRNTDMCREKGNQYPRYTEQRKHLYNSDQ